MGKEAFVEAAWDVVGRKVSKADTVWAVKPLWWRQRDNQWHS